MFGAGINRKTRFRVVVSACQTAHIDDTPCPNMVCVNNIQKSFEKMSGIIFFTFAGFQKRQENADGIHYTHVVDSELLLAVLLCLPFQLSTDAVSCRVDQCPQT